MRSLLVERLLTLKVSGRLQVGLFPMRKVKQKGVTLKLESNLWEL